MIYGIGTDIIEVARIRLALHRHGEGFAKRVLANSEWPEYLACAVPERFLAKRFAAKEAFAKALGLGIRKPVTWHNIHVHHDKRGKPMLNFQPELCAFLNAKGIGGYHLSISDEKQLATAFVILEKASLC